MVGGKKWFSLSRREVLVGLRLRKKPRKAAVVFEDVSNRWQVRFFDPEYRLWFTLPLHRDLNDESDEILIESAKKRVKQARFTLHRAMEFSVQRKRS